ncbi:MAG: DUF4430 domain-containing protein [Oscillospiraceae bacterium]|nr:DUF4430 domain-containing protein [Oscillospiraceae bacterium]
MKTAFIAVILAVFASGCFSGENSPEPFESPPEIEQAASAAAAYLLDAVITPKVGSVGGDWAVLGLARSGCDVPDDYYESYHQAVRETVAACGGVLDERKYTEYSRVILGLTAAGYDPRNVAGFDLTAPLEDYGSVMRQGVNGAAYALLALDSLGYPNNRREDYIAAILSVQLAGGGWNLTANAEEEADPDVTGAVLQALAKYQHQLGVEEAIEKALECLSKQQNPNGGFSSWGNENVLSSVQVLVALCELGLPADDPRFVKDGVMLIGNILSYQNTDGSFNQTYGSGSNQMATEQAFYGLVAAQRVMNGKNSLYRMDDVLTPSGGTFTVTLTVRCDTLLEQLDLLDKEKHELVPADGVIVPLTTVTAVEGDSVFDLLQREMKNAKIHMAFQNTPLYNSSYIKAIHNIYEYDAGVLSGWQFSVNGLFSGVGVSQVLVQPNDRIEFHYTCDLGRDLGQDWLGG